MAKEKKLVIEYKFKKERNWKASIFGALLLAVSVIGPLIYSREVNVDFGVIALGVIGFIIGIKLVFWGSEVISHIWEEDKNIRIIEK